MTNSTLLMPVSRLVRQETCANCKFHGSQPNGQGIDCRKEPVKSAIVTDRQGNAHPVTYFPPVKPDWWCGEWKPRIEVAA